MKSTTAVLYLALSLPAAMATTHTMCYNYFMQKDGCVFSAAASDQRCPAPPKQHTAAVQAFECPSTVSQKTKRSEVTSQRLERRYDTTRPSFAVAGGQGICGSYDSATTPGVCLWSGPEQNNPTVDTAGWLNGAKTSNCGKRVYIQRKGQPNTVQFVKVLDGCSFGTKQPDPGCFDVALTLNLFNLFKPTPQELKDGLIYGGITWDFDNLDNTHTQQAPV